MGGLLGGEFKPKRVKRGGRKYRKNQKSSKCLTIFSTNAASLKGKIHSLKNELNSSQAAVFTIQESHFGKKGKLKIENYEIFEAIRKKQKGGTIIGVHKGLKPILIKEYSDEFELIVVEIQIKNKEIRIMSGYGPQERWPEVDRMPFFMALEQEIIKAEMQGKSMFIEMDSNSKLGPQLIPKDPHSQSGNGKVLADVIARHGLIVANGSRDKCVGAITRKRVTKESTEESMIDHVIISEDLEKDMTSIFIDEERTKVLEKITKTKKDLKKQLSDHNPIITNFDIQWNRKLNKQRLELFNLKNKESQAKFKDLTSKDGILSSALLSGVDIHTSTRHFLKVLNDCIRKCFKKVRITDKPNSEIEELFKQRQLLKTRGDAESKIELENIENKLADKCAQKNYEIIKDEIDKIDCEEGGVNSGHLWKLKKK